MKGAAQDGLALIGTWKLVTWTREVIDTGEVTNIFGQSPRGLITYTSDGRMFVLIVSEDRPRPGDQASMTDTDRVILFKSVVAYAGTYRRVANRVIHSVDISWNEIWTGTEQVRELEFDGTHLSLKTPPTPSPVDGKLAVATLIWQRLGDHAHHGASI